ncbi:MAG TPA: hypothetical protein VNW54_16540 [Granulicella sp.]|nr:hypothetical protein [Granulicella sp.]
MKKLGILLLIGLLDSPVQKSITLADPGGIDTVTFPVASFTEGEAKAIMRLSPRLRMQTSYPVIYQIEMCNKEDNAYRGCGKQVERQRWFERNAKVNICRMKNALTELDDLPHTWGLEPIIQYMRSLQKFYIAVNEVRLHFHYKGDVSLLERPIEGIDPRIHCADSLVNVTNAGSRQAADEIVLHNWYNCMNGQMRTRSGAYPMDAWIAFLQKSGIRETYTPVDE